MKHRNIQGIFIAILLSLFVIIMVAGNNAMAYYGGVSSPTGNPYTSSSLYGGYGMYGGGLYGGGGMYGGGLYGGMYGMYGGMYGMYGGMYGGGLYGSMYGGIYGGMYGGGIYGGMYGGGLYGGMYGMYGGYGGTLSLGLTNLMNPLPYYTYGGMYNLLNTFDPLGDPLLGFGMLSLI